MKARWVFTLTAALWLGAAGRDGLDHWVETTELPPIVPETSVEVRDRHGALLRAYTVADGLWRLGAAPEDGD